MPLALVVVFALTVVFEFVSPPIGRFVFKFVIVSACDEGLVSVLALVMVSLVVSEDVCKTETFPVSAGIESSSAVSIKSAAAPIVILDKTD